MMFLALILTMIQTEQPITLIVESSADLFGRAVSMTARADQRIIVADQNDNTVKIVNADNTIQQSIGGKGWGTESFDMPGDVSTSFLLDLFVSDNNNRRVQRYDKQMQFIHGYTEATMSEAGSIQPVASAVALSGEIFILDADGRRVLQLNPRSIIEKEFGNYTTTLHRISDPRDIAVSANNQVVVLDASRVLVFDVFGNFIRSISLPPSHDWKSLSVNGPWLLMTASDRILMHHRESGSQYTITVSSFLGTTITETFSDAMILNDRFILLTSTTLYRCTISAP